MLKDMVKEVMMPEFTQSILIALIPSLIVAVFTSFLSVRLALKRFYSQRWWEKQAEAYSQILEHLSYLRFESSEWLDDLQGGITLNTDDEKRLSEGYKRSRESLIRTAAIGEFIVTGTTTEALSKLLTKLASQHFEEDLYLAVEKSHEAVTECIKIVREDAKEALLRMTR